jgi:hypothetical protein
LHAALELLAVDVLDVRAQHPLVTKRIAQPSATVAVEP